MRSGTWIAFSLYVDLVAYVSKDIADLLSAFLPNRRIEVETLRRGLAHQDWASLQHIAERMYALGNPYGFRQITTFGRSMREACAQEDPIRFEHLIMQYAEYLRQVTIVEVDAPINRRILSPASRRTLFPHRASDVDGSTMGEDDSRSSFIVRR